MQHDRLLELAIKGLEAEKARIDQELAELQKGTSAGTSAGSEAAPQAAATIRRRTLSAAARKKISEAMKKRHALRRAAAKK